MAGDAVKIHMRRETGQEFDETTVWGQSKPVSMSRMRQYKDAIGLARERRKRKKLEENKVRIRNYVEPLDGDGLDSTTWRGGGSNIKQDIIVPLRKRYAQFMGTGEWNPAQIIEPEQAEALPSETRVIPDVGGQLEAEWTPGPYGRAPVGGYRGIPMQKGVPLPQQDVDVGAPWTGAPWTGLSNLAAIPNSDPDYAPEVTGAVQRKASDGGIEYGYRMSVKKPGNVFFTYHIGFQDGTALTMTSNVVRAAADTPFDVYFHITPAQLASVAGKYSSHFALTFYVTKGLVGLRRKQIAQVTQ